MKVNVLALGISLHSSITTNYRRTLERLEENGQKEFRMQLEQIGKVHTSMLESTRRNLDMQQASHQQQLEMQKLMNTLIDTIQEDHARLDRKLDLFLKSDQVDREMYADVIRSIHAMAGVVREHTHSRHSRDTDLPTVEPP